MGVLADEAGEINQRWESSEIKDLVRHRVGITPKPGTDLESSRAIAVEQIRDRREDHRAEGDGKPEVGQRLVRKDADGQKDENQRHAHQGERLNEVKFGFQVWVPNTMKRLLSATQV